MIRWLSWDHMCNFKTEGYMSFQNLQAFNIVILAKQCWRLITNLRSLLTQIYKTKYYHVRSFMMATLGHNLSYAWRSLFSAQPLLSAGVH